MCLSTLIAVVKFHYRPGLPAVNTIVGPVRFKADGSVDRRSVMVADRRVYWLYKNPNM